MDNQMRPGDLVSIMTTSGGTGALQQLTNDKRQLYAALDRIHYVTGRTGLTWYAPVNKGDAASVVESEANARLGGAGRYGSAADTGSAIAFAIRGLREMPGRKAIALFSDGFPEGAGNIVELANRSSVVLYTFDPRGVVSFALTAVDKCASCANRGDFAKIDSAESGRETFYRGAQRSLEQMARGTGGLFFHDNNDLIQGMTSAVEDMSGYYLIAYQPRRPDFDKIRGVPQFHRIEVKLLRPGLRVRSRNGFVGTPDPDSGRERRGTEYCEGATSESAVVGLPQQRISGAPERVLFGGREEEGQRP